MGWDERYIEKYKEKQATYTVCFSFDESECWIRQVKLHPKKADASVLKIPKKIKGAFTGEVLDNTEGNLRVTVSPKNKTYAVSGKCVYNKKTGD